MINLFNSVSLILRGKKKKKTTLKFISLKMKILLKKKKIGSIYDSMKEPVGEDDSNIIFQFLFNFKPQSPRTIIALNNGANHPEEYNLRRSYGQMKHILSQLLKTQ